MRLVFFGTPSIALPTLKALAARAGLRPLAVFTQPPARRSRRGEAESCEVAVEARRLGLELHEVETVNEGLALERLRELQPEVIVVVSFGQILKRAVLTLPRHGCLNFHPSLLPKYRGAAPVQRAIMAGERVSGLSIMRLVKKLDAGPLLLQEPWPLGEEADAEALLAEAGERGALLMLRVLESLERGEPLVAVPQDDSLATFAPPLTKEDGHLDFRRRAVELRDQIRGVQPWPRASCELLLPAGVRRVIVHRASCRQGQGQPGRIEALDERGLVVGSAEGLLCLEAVQLEGKSVQGGRALANGLRLKVGDVFATGARREQL